MYHTKMRMHRAASQSFSMSIGQPKFDHPNLCSRMRMRRCVNNTSVHWCSVGSRSADTTWHSRKFPPLSAEIITSPILLRAAQYCIISVYSQICSLPSLSHFCTSQLGANLLSMQQPTRLDTLRCDMVHLVTFIVLRRKLKLSVNTSTRPIPPRKYSHTVQLTIRNIRFLVVHTQKIAANCIISLIAQSLNNAIYNPLHPTLPL